ncbi:hypothetical protein [Plantactinospora sp. B24E8]|uniref:hypothetical protein n=1 Tax=Plantactinospora sp. B24E8 TaxID=3153567 RepID=UPI00325E969A
MPLPEIRRYTGLVRLGVGTEAERLALMRVHRERALPQIAQLTRCLDLVNYKVGVHEDAIGAAAP